MSFLDKARPVATTTPSGAPSFVQKARPTAPKREFRFDVPEPEQERQNRIGLYQQEAQASAEEAKKANSFMGLAKNTLKEAGGILANSEVGLGRSIAKIIGAGDATLQNAQKQASDTQVRLLKAIRDKEARGEDATNLKQEYNRWLQSPENKEVTKLLGEQFNLPTTGQVAGQIGGTALDVLTAGTYGKATQFMQPGKLAVQGKVSAVVGSIIPSTFVQGSKQTVKNIATGVGVPELGAIAGQKATGIFTKQGAKNIGTGLGIGYASDVTQGLQGARGEDRTGAKAFIPGAGTVIGGALPVVSEGTQSVKNRFTNEGQASVASQKRTQALQDAQKRYARVDKAFTAARNKGVDVDGILSNTNLLNGAVDEDGLVSAERALGNFDEMVAPYEGKVREAIQKEGAKVRISDVASAMDDFVGKTNLQGNAQKQLETQLLGDLKGLQSRYGDNIPVEALHDIKVFRGLHSNYMDTGANAVNKEATRLFKEVVEKNVRSLDVQNYNANLSKLYSVRDALESLDKTRVKGGRAGKYFSTLVGTTVGASSGNPLLAILGAEIGARTQGGILSRSFGGDIQKGLEIPSEMTDLLQTKVPRKDVIPPVVLPKKGVNTGDINLQSSSKEGSRKTSQPTTKSIPIKAIPDTVLPSKKKSSALPTQGKEMFAGGAVGIEKDENGEWVFNEEKALAGMVGVAGLTRSQAVQKLSKNLDSGTRKMFTDFIDAVRGENIVTKSGKLTFKTPEAEKAFMRGLDFINGSAGKELELNRMADKTPNKLADFYEDIVSKK